MPIIDKIQLSGTVYTIGSENSGVTSGEVQTMIDNSLSGYVYTADNGKQDIYGSKTFIGEKRINFTQGTSTNKPGFTIYGVRDAEGNASQLGTFELNPTAITESNTTFPLLSLGHYRSGNRRASVQSYIGFRQYDYDNSAAYHLLAPLPQNAKTPFSLTTTFKNFYMPLGIKVDNSTMVKADSGGVMDISSYIGGGSITIDPSLNTGSTNAVANSAITTAINDRATKGQAYGSTSFGSSSGKEYVRFEKVNGTRDSERYISKINGFMVWGTTNINACKNWELVETSAITTSVTSSSTDSQVPSAKAVNDKLGGLSLVKLTQAEYDALATKDSNVLYVIVG